MPLGCPPGKTITLATGLTTLVCTSSSRSWEPCSRTRPVLGFEWYYRTQLAGPLWQEGITSFDLTDKSPDDVVRLIHWLDDERIERMSAAAAARFREVVSFDEEERTIRAMFETIL